MKIIKIASLLALLFFACWMIFEDVNFPEGFLEYIENSEFLTLEVKQTPEQIIAANRDDLLASPHHTLLEPELKYQPHLLMEVKYCQADKRTCESSILWSQVDGEMVLSTDSWDKTRGFSDAISSGATANDFKVLMALAKNGGKAPRETIIEDLSKDPHFMEGWLESAKRKHLITQSGDSLQLHFQNPKMNVLPRTTVSHKFVNKAYDHDQKESRKYSRSQIELVARSIFGEDFAIKSTTEVYLPVYNIQVLNPDGSILSSYWNAVNGKKI